MIGIYNIWLKLSYSSIRPGNSADLLLWLLKWYWYQMMDMHNMKVWRRIMTFFFVCGADHLAFYASLPSPLPHRAGWWPLQCTLECVPDFHLPRDLLYCCHGIPEYQGLSLITHSNIRHGCTKLFCMWLMVVVLPFTDYQTENRQQPLCQGIQRWGHELKKVSNGSRRTAWISFLFFIRKRQFWRFWFLLPNIDVQTEAQLIRSGWLRGWTRWSGTRIKIAHRVWV